MKPFYRPVFLDAWNATRKNFFLLPIAFLASFVVVSADARLVFDLLLQPSDNSLFTSITQTDFITGAFVSWNQAFNLISVGKTALVDIPVLLMLLLLFVIVFGLATIIISAEGGLIYALKQVFDKKKTTFLQSFRQGFDKFWILFFLYIVYALIFLVVANLIVIPSAYIALTVAPAMRITIVAFAYFITIPLIAILTLVKRYSQMFIMLAEPGSKKHSTFAASLVNSFRDAWILFRTNWIISIETIVLISITMIAAAFLALAILMALVILFGLFGVLLAPFNTAFQLVVLLAILITVVVLACIISFFTAFQMAVWVGVFERLTTGIHQSKTHRVFRHLPWLHRKLI